MSKTIPQLNPATSLQLTNKIEVSQSDSLSANSLYGTYQQVVDDIVNPNAQILESQVTNLVTDLATLQTNIDTVQTNLTDHIDDVANPHQTTLQQAFDQNNIIVVDTTALIINDTNDNQVLAAATKGTQSHAPIYHLGNGQTINLASQDVDTVFVNDTAVSGSNTINIQLETVPLYADNSTFTAWRDGAQPLIVQAAVGVSIDGVDNATITLSAGQYVKFIRMNTNEFVSLTATSEGGVSSLNNLVGDLAITSTDGTIIVTPSGSSVDLSLSGSGASAGYGYVSVSPSSGQTGYADMTIYTIPFAVNSTLVSECNNLIAFFDGSSHMGIKNIGTETGVYEFTFTCVYVYGGANTNSASNNYVMSANLNLTGGPGGSFAPINPLGGGSSSASDVPFTVFPNYSTTVNFTFQFSLAPNDVVYPAFRNVGPSSDPANVPLSMPYYIINAQKIGDVGGTSAGVASLNGLTGDLNVTSLDDSLSVNISDPNIDVSINTSSFTSDCVMYFDGTSLTNNGALTFNGADSINLESSATSLTALSVINSFTGSTCASEILLSRGDTTFGEARLRFRDIGTDVWDVGTQHSNSNLHFRNAVSSTDILIINQAGTITIPALTASLPLFTDSASNLTTTGTVPAGSGGTGQPGGYTVGDVLYASGASTLSKLAAVASGSVLASAGVGVAPAWSTFPTLSRLSLTNGGVPISGTNAVIDVASAASDGTYIAIGGGGRSIGQFSGGNLFLANNLNYNASVNSFFYAASAGASSIELGTSGGSLKYAPSGTAGNAITTSIALSWDTSGNVNIPNLSASQLVVTDGSSNLVSGGAIPSGFTNFVTVTSTPITAVGKTFYYNNYGSGQAIYNLPAATGTNSIIAVMGLNSANIAGWQLQAQSGDKIQVGNLVSVANGTVSSTAGFSTDIIFLIDAGVNLWVAFDFVGSNLIIV